LREIEQIPVDDGGAGHGRPLASVAHLAGVPVPLPPVVRPDDSFFVDHVQDEILRPRSAAPVMNPTPVKLARDGLAPFPAQVEPKDVRHRIDFLRLGLEDDTLVLPVWAPDPAEAEWRNTPIVEATARVLAHRHGRAVGVHVAFVGVE